MRKEERVSNRVPFAVDTLPECLEKEPNNSIADAPAGHAADHRQRAH